MNHHTVAARRLRLCAALVTRDRRLRGINEFESGTPLPGLMLEPGPALVQTCAVALTSRGAVQSRIAADLSLLRQCHLREIEFLNPDNCIALRQRQGSVLIDLSAP